MAAQDERVPRSLIVKCAQPLPVQGPPDFTIILRQREEERDRWTRAWWEWRRARWIYCQQFPWRCRQEFDYWYSGQDPGYRDYYYRYRDSRDWRSGRDWRDGYFYNDRGNSPYRDNDRDRHDRDRDRWDHDRDRR